MKKYRKKTGLRIAGNRGELEVRAALIKYAKWLRVRYEFPILVAVYLSASKRITTVDNEVVTASFFYPFDRKKYPRIRIATGDYCELVGSYGRDNALAAMLCSLSHELVHYWQWIDSGTTTERGVVVRAENMVHAYSQHVDEP